MKYVRFGSTGMQMSKICLVCMTYGVPDRGSHRWMLDEEQSRPLIHKTLDLSINFFDTANSYSDGASEEIAEHPTAPYIAKVREVRALAPGVALLRAVVGMVPPGQSEINPAVNAVQLLVAVNQVGEWRIAVFQNTPAQFHGRPELVQQLTDELRQMGR